MSLQSKLRQASRDALLGRTKIISDRRAPKPYRPSPFNVTEFQRRAHQDVNDAVQDERDSRMGARGAYSNWAKEQFARVKNWPVWGRDGFASEVHYVVHHSRLAVLGAANDATHPMHEIAQKAKELKLIPA